MLSHAIKRVFPHYILIILSHLTVHFIKETQRNIVSKRTKILLTRRLTTLNLLYFAKKTYTYK